MMIDLKDKIDETLIQLNKKYQKYQEFVSAKEIKKYVLNHFSYSKTNDNIAIDIAIKMEMDNLIFYYLCQKAQENIDLEIFMIDQLTNLCNLVFRKIKNVSSNNDKEKEDIIIQAIESYDGKISFSLHLTRLVMSKQNNTYSSTNKNFKIEDKPKINNRKKVVNDYKEDQKCFIDEIEKYRKKHFVSNVPDYFQYIFHKFCMLDYIDIHDQKFKQYLILKNGFYENLYFSDLDIKIIINQSDEKIREYRILNLKLLKSGLNQLFDEATKFIEKTI